MIDERQRFKAAYLQAGAAYGLTLDELEKVAEQTIDNLENPEKRASFRDVLGGIRDVGGMTKDVAVTGINAASPFVKMLLAAGLLTPLAVGGLMGFGSNSAKHENIDSTDLKNQELIDAYRNATDTIRSGDMLRNKRQTVSAPKPSRQLQF